MAKPTIKSVVLENAEDLKTRDLKGLFEFAKEQGWDSKAGFSRFKKALLEIDVDYAAMRAGRDADRHEELMSKIQHEVTLYSDAKAKTSRFAITNSNGRGIWYGRFFDDDKDFTGEQSTGEKSAARKAIYLASRISKACGDEGIRLYLYVDAEWLTTLSGKASVLAADARRLNIDLQMRWVPGRDNPADELTVSGGYKSLRNLDDAVLASFAEPLGELKPDPRAMEDDTDEVVDEPASMAP